MSLVVNFDSTNYIIAFFHLYHFIALSILASCPRWLALRFAHLTLLIYSASILLAFAFAGVGLQSVVGFLIADGSSSMRIAAFATEPSYAGLLVLIRSRFV